MDNTCIEKEPIEKVNKLKIDLLIVNDDIDNEALAIVDECKEIKVKTVFVCDHNVPANSVQNVKKQNKMMSIADRHSFQLFYGIGIGYNVIFNDLSTQKVVVSNESTVSMFGGIGVLGLKVKDMRCLKEVVDTGTIDFIDFIYKGEL